jgi:hypothetical protein
MEITVKSCATCPMYVRLETLNYKWCGYPNRPDAAAEIWVDLFATCPLKNDSLTIKLVIDEQTTS